jgi:hypothetical protein
MVTKPVDHSQFLACLAWPCFMLLDKKRGTQQHKDRWRRIPKNSKAGKAALETNDGPPPTCRDLERFVWWLFFNKTTSVYGCTTTTHHRLNNCQYPQQYLQYQHLPPILEYCRPTAAAPAAALAAASSKMARQPLD